MGMSIDSQQILSESTRLPSQAQKNTELLQSGNQIFNHRDMDHTEKIDGPAETAQV